jgi:HEAT repeat protein
MKKMILFIGMVLLTLPLFSQEEEEQTIEELYLQHSMQQQIIQAEAYSNDMDMKLIAISDIQAMVENGEIAEDDYFTLQILYDLGQEGVTREIREQGHVINDFPIVRKEACRLLGEVGGDQARTYLINILLNDPEPMVMSEAIIAIAKCGLDEKGDAQRAMASSMYRQSATMKDNNFAVAYMNSIELLVKDGYKITDPIVWEEVVKIADPSSGYTSIVQQRALNLLKFLQDTSD